MKDEKIIILLKSGCREDTVIAADYLVNNRTKEEMIEFFDIHGEKLEQCKEDYYLSRKIIESPNYSEVWYIKNDEVLIFMGFGIWLLDPKTYNIIDQYEDRAINKTI